MRQRENGLLVLGVELRHQPAAQGLACFLLLKAVMGPSLVRVAVPGKVVLSEAVLFFMGYYSYSVVDCGSIDRSCCVQLKKKTN